LEHKSLAASVLAGVMFLILLTHLGLLGRLYELLRRRSRS
jgi:hypothetical protein